MAQHDQVIDNGPGLAVRTDINAALAALFSSSSGSIEPVVKVPGQLWFDTSVALDNEIRMRNQANSDWVTLQKQQAFLDALAGVGPNVVADDLLVGVAANSLVRFPKGTNLQRLIVNSSGHLAWADDNGVPSCSVQFTLLSAAPIGWIMFDDGTVGTTGSGSSYANPLSVNVFNALFANAADADCPLLTSAGGATTRAAQGSAGAAFAAGCRMTLPKVLGRALAGAGAGASLTARAMGAKFGEENHLLTTPEMPSHTHGVGLQIGVAVTAGGTALPQQNVSSNSNSTATGGGGSHNNMQPTTFLNTMVKL